MNLLPLANAFTIIQDNWGQVAPYGDYPHIGPVDPRTHRPLHPKGCLQRFDNTAATSMVTEFNSFASKVGRLFGGRPWYVGHHDVDPIKYPDPKAYGWIMKLENRADGLYAQVKWTPAGEQLKENGEFKYFSPYWNCTDSGKTDTQGRLIAIPNRLNSVGFTNDPNIPVMPLSNEKRGITTCPAETIRQLSPKITAQTLTTHRAQKFRTVSAQVTATRLKTTRSP